ncbi:MAG: UvrD-helicase domain-containing protein [Bacteroidales bacterium]|nr:UvrD-helicase domain-containing protein [Bacteroidales bacterium]
MKDEILEGLNSEQAKAVSQTEGPVLIVAGAGSGKTRVLTCRIANILDKGVKPSGVLSLTFTKKAASEMKERVAAMVGGRVARGVVMGTFHSVFIRFLRDYAEFLGYPKQFTVYDQSDSTAMVKTCLKELNLDDKVYKPKTVLGRISEAKNNLASPAAYIANSVAVEHDRNCKMPRLAEVYDLYWRKCREAGVMDFDDILFEMNILLRDNPDALEEISSRFSHILVDEYQDTNRAQYIILKKLAAKHRNICVVGDDSQSIYAFRGAKIENILNFKRDYPSCVTFRLEQNYRSTKTIVEAANSLIAHNESRIPKTCFSMGDDGELIRLVKSYTEQEEAALVVGRIADTIRADGVQYQDFAILYRTNAQSRAIEEALRRRNIPYIIYSGNSFFERAEVKDLMSYFKLTVNPSDDEAFKRVVNKPARGIGDTSLAALQAAAMDRHLPLMQAVYEPDLESYGLKPAAVAKIRAFADMMVKFNGRIGEDAYQLAMDIATGSGLLAFYKSDMSVEGQARFANVEELCNSVKAYIEQCESDAYEDAIAAGDDVSAQPELIVTLPEYLENVALLSAVDVQEDEDSSNKVALMTVHSSKGLEFPYVYVVGMEENLFPSGGQLARPSDIEEERRLFYVAITRAMKSVCLSFASTRMRNGRSESNSVSRFVYEIDPQYIANPLAEGMKELRAQTFWSSVRTGSATPTEPEAPRAVKRGYMPSSLSGSAGSANPGFPRQFGPAQQGSHRTETTITPNTTGWRGPMATGVAGHQGSAKPVDPDFVASPIMDLKEGQKVEHNRFGFGEIKQLSRAEGKVIIDFEDYGEKTLLLKFAKIRIV